MNTTLVLIGIFVIAVLSIFKVKDNDMKENKSAFFIAFCSITAIGFILAWLLSWQMTFEELSETQWFPAIAVGVLFTLIPSVWFSVEYKAGLAFLIICILFGICLAKTVLESNNWYVGIFFLGGLLGYLIIRIVSKINKNT